MSVLKFADLEDENFELKKEVAALRRALKSHGEIVEENHKLREKLRTSIETSDKIQRENARLRLSIKDYLTHIEFTNVILEHYREGNSQGWDLIGLIENGKNLVEKSR